MYPTVLCGTPAVQLTALSQGHIGSFTDDVIQVSSLPWQPRAVHAPGLPVFKSLRMPWRQDSSQPTFVLNLGAKAS